MKMLLNNGELVHSDGSHNTTNQIITFGELINAFCNTVSTEKR